MSDLVNRVAALIADEYASPAAKDPSQYIARIVVDMVLDEATGHVHKARNGEADSDLRSIIHCIRALGGDR
jgi:hypothetical protein